MSRYSFCESLCGIVAVSWLVLFYAPAPHFRGPREGGGGAASLDLVRRYSGAHQGRPVPGCFSCAAHCDPSMEECKMGRRTRAARLKGLTLMPSTSHGRPSCAPKQHVQIH